jgi:DNA-binding MarR family transcriptional regulator
MTHEADAAIRAEAFSELTLAVYRVHGALLTRGDAVVASLGLTSARWQVLGTIAGSSEAPSVPAVAGAMGLSRQAIQKQVDLLEQEGLVLARPNPAHGRSPLFQLTGAGRAAFARADQRWSIEAAQLTEPLALSSLKAATRLLEQLSERLRSRADNDVSTE